MSALHYTGYVTLDNTILNIYILYIIYCTYILYIYILYLSIATTQLPKARRHPRHRKSPGARLWTPLFGSSNSLHLAEQLAERSPLHMWGLPPETYHLQMVCLYDFMVILGMVY